MSGLQCGRLCGALSLRPLVQRSFSTTASCASLIGRQPVTIPSGVSIEVIDINPPELQMRRVKGHRVVEVTGPLGKASMKIYPYINIEKDEDKKRATVSVEDRNVKEQLAMWGTTRAYLQNYVLGVSEGHSVILRLVGVGYRATVETSATTTSPEYPGQHFVNLKVGYSHPIELGVPEGVKASTPQPTRILLEGPDKEVVTRFAATIRKWRVPEPYKGKGIFVNDETIKLKAKKIK